MERTDLTAPTLQPGGPALRVVHLSDLHVRAFRRRHEALTRVVRELEPDLIAISGDMVVDRKPPFPHLMRLMSGLRAPGGVFACRGNWELRHDMRPATMRGMLKECGAELLVNESRLVETPAGRVSVGGVDDLQRGWPNFGEALEGADEADCSLLLCHEPLGARLLPDDCPVDLMLSGHTHAGQVRIPWLWRLALPEYHGGFYQGLYPTPWGHLYVNRGFGGTGPLPVRFRCPAEVALLHIAPPERR